MRYRLLRFLLLNRGFYCDSVLVVLFYSGRDLRLVSSFRMLLPLQSFHSVLVAVEKGFCKRYLVILAVLLPFFAMRF